MITINLRDPNLEANLEAVNILRQSGLFTDEQIQEMYDRQVEMDRKYIGEEK